MTAPLPAASADAAAGEASASAEGGEAAATARCGVDLLGGASGHVAVIGGVGETVHPVHHPEHVVGVPAGAVVAVRLRVREEVGDQFLELFRHFVGDAEERRVGQVVAPEADVPRFALIDDGELFEELLEAKKLEEFLFTGLGKDRLVGSEEELLFGDVL